MKNYKELESQNIVHTYGRFDVCFESGQGSILKDIDGKEYVDFTSGIGVNCLGYNNPKWTEAVAKQACTLQHISNLYYTKPMIDLAQSLCEKSGLSKVFFANSGAEANEGMIKTARKTNESRHTIITLQNSFHGRTITTLKATGQDVFHKHFGPFPDGFAYCPANDLDTLKSMINEDTLAIMMEMIQGEGGVMPLDYDFVQGVKKICEENDILLLVDEVQTGVGRTGSFMCYQQYDILPDIISVAKGIGGGLPLAAFVTGEKCKDVLQPGDHGATFGGNPVSCAGGNVVMEYMTEEFFQEVKEKGAYLRARLEAMPQIVKVNGLGLMLGAQLKEGIAVRDVINACIEKGVVFLSAKANLRCLPPLVITKEEIARGMDILEEVLSNMN